MVVPTVLALVWLVGVEPAPTEDDAANPVPPAPAEPTGTGSGPEEPSVEIVSPFDELTPVPPPPRVDRSDLFDPWEVPLQSVVRRPEPTRRVQASRELPLLDPWRRPGPVRVRSRTSPDLRHPFAPDAAETPPLATASGNGATDSRVGAPMARPTRPATRIAHADLRDPFTRSPVVDVPPPVIASPPDLRDPFRARARPSAAPPVAQPGPETEVTAEPPAPLPSPG